MCARLLTAVAVALMSLYMASPAAADIRPPEPGGGAYVDGSGRPTATAQDGGAIGAPDTSSTGAGGAPDPCIWEVVIEDDLQMSIYDVDTLETMHSNTGRWLQYVCPGVGPVAVDGAFVIPEGGLVDPAALAAEALSSIGIQGPVVRTSPGSDDLVVNVPTWLWVDPGWWKPYEATAAAGRVTATVTARPTSILWSTGDGSAIRCDAGRPWRPGLAEAATDCSHTYRRAAGGLDLSATVVLEVTWTSNIGPGGSLPAISRTSTVEVTVGEIQAIGED
jgi:hypothetical protein